MLNQPLTELLGHLGLAPTLLLLLAPTTTRASTLKVQTDHHWSHRLHCRHSLRCLERRHQSLHLRHQSHRRHHLHRLHLLYFCPHYRSHCHLHHHCRLLHYPGHPCSFYCSALH
ncbi:unnamed protein product [Closterium sp. NIES-54]